MELSLRVPNICQPEIGNVRCALRSNNQAAVSRRNKIFCELYFKISKCAYAMPVDSGRKALVSHAAQCLRGVALLRLQRSGRGEVELRLAFSVGTNWLFEGLRTLEFGSLAGGTNKVLPEVLEFFPPGLLVAQ